MKTCFYCGKPDFACNCKPRGRKSLPPEQRRVQRTVSLDHDDDYHLQALAMERGQSVPQVIEGIVAVHLSTVIGGAK